MGPRPSPRFNRGCGLVGFPTPPGLTPLGSPLPWTPRPVFQDGRRHPNPPLSYSRVAPVSFEGFHFFRAAPCVAAWFQALFTPLAGCFSAFPHGTKFAIGLGTYLALEVGDPQLPTAQPSRGTLLHGASPHSLAYGAVTLCGGPFQATSATVGRLARGRTPSRGADNPTSPRGLPVGVWFRLPPFRSPLLRGSRLISSPPPTKMFPFGGFPPGTPSRFPGRHGLRTRGGRSHSAIPGSTAACAYPGLIAACHGLPRRPSRAIHQAASSP